MYKSVVLQRSIQALFGDLGRLKLNSRFCIEGPRYFYCDSHEWVEQTRFTRLAATGRNDEVAWRDLQWSTVSAARSASRRSCSPTKDTSIQTKLVPIYRRRTMNGGRPEQMLAKFSLDGLRDTPLTEPNLDSGRCLLIMSSAVLPLHQRTWHPYPGCQIL